MVTLGELLFIKFMYLWIYLTEVNPQILACTSLKNHRVSESFSINVMAQLARVGLRKSLHVTDPNNS